MTVETFQCYICYDESSLENPFATDPPPCECKGSIVIHVSCLKNMYNFKKSCDVCQNPFNPAYGRQRTFNENGLEEITVHHENGRVKTHYFLNADEKLQGLYASYYEDGSLEEWMHYDNGILDGKYEEYFYNGKKKVDANYIHGQFHGPYMEYHCNGSLRDKGHYVRGMKDGTWVSYYSNGQLCYKCMYVHDEYHGVVEKYHRNGLLWKYGVFTYGSGSFKEYDGNGKEVQTLTV